MAFIYGIERNNKFYVYTINDIYILLGISLVTYSASYVIGRSVRRYIEKRARKKINKEICNTNNRKILVNKRIILVILSTLVFKSYSSTLLKALLEKLKKELKKREEKKALLGKKDPPMAIRGGDFYDYETYSKYVNFPASLLKCVLEDGVYRVINSDIVKSALKLFKNQFITTRPETS